MKLHDPDKAPILQRVSRTTPPCCRRLCFRLATLVLSGAALTYFILNSFFPHLILVLFGSLPIAYSKCHKEQRMPLEMLEEIMLLTPRAEEARKHSEYYTSGAHLGGKNLSQAMWTKERWEEYGIPEVEIVTYDIYTNYPKGHRLGLLKAASNDSYELLYEAGLTEEVLEQDPTTGSKDNIPTFHGYSANGNVTAEYIFANYGTYLDFEQLLENGVNITGKVVLCKYGYIFRGLKVKRAQDLGAVGVLIYSDPGDDGNITELNGYKAYPDGPARNKNSVQRGSVQFLSLGPGDPTTPGYASKPGVPRQDPSAFIPSIPSLPISYVDALPLLQALNGHGLNSTDLGKYWRTGGLYHKNVTYNIGPAPGIVVNLVNEVEYVTTPQWDVIGKIPGYIPDESVILGNHRDAWIVGGAADPNSGSSALLELARSFGKMLEAGWKPARTIILASWDGEEYGLLGSTEWVEDNQKLLHTSALAYINVDVGARGPVFAVAANPLLQDVIHSATKKVVDPNSADAGNFDSTVFDIWNKRINILGSGSDYTAFQDHLGIPSIDMGFSGAKKDGPVYHYHSNYDSFKWMERFGDPGFKYHVAMAKVWGLIALQLVESPIVPFNATAYASGLLEYLARIRAEVEAVSGEYTDHPPPHHPPPHHPPPHHPPPHHPPPHHPPPHHPPHHPPPDHPPPHHPHHPPCHNITLPYFLHHLHHLSQTLTIFQHHARRFDLIATNLSRQLRHIQKLPWYHRIPLLIRARITNQRYKFLDRAFIFSPGLDGREWFKHVVFAPGKWTGYEGDAFPGLVESVRAKDWEAGVRWCRIITEAVTAATMSLGRV